MKSYLRFLSRNKLYTAIEAVGLAYWDKEELEMNSPEVQAAP